MRSGVYAALMIFGRAFTICFSAEYRSFNSSIRSSSSVSTLMFGHLHKGIEYSDVDSWARSVVRTLTEALIRGPGRSTFDEGVLARFPVSAGPQRSHQTCEKPPPSSAEARFIASNDAGRRSDKPSNCQQFRIVDLFAPHAVKNPADAHAS